MEEASNVDDASSVDELGPVDWIVVEFPGSTFNGEMAPALGDLVDRELIRVLDVLVLKKDDDGSVEAFEISDLEESEVGALRAYEAELAMLLSEDDVTAIANAIDPGSSAAVLVWENTWAVPLATAIRHSGGQLVASGRIPIQALRRGGRGQRRVRRRAGSCDDGRSLTWASRGDAFGVPQSSVPPQ